MSGTLHDDMTPALLDRYLCGECAGDEVVRVHAWVAAHPDHIAQLAELRMVREIVAHRPVWNMRSMWENVTSRLGQSDSMGAQRRSEPITRSASLTPGYQRLQATPLLGKTFKAQPLRRPGVSWQTVRRGTWYLAAAIVMGVVGLTVGWHGGAHRLDGHALRPVSTYTTINGQRANITLLDGTTVALNVGSQLDVPSDFLTGNRTVHLTGEALFTVPHHTDTPFRVATGPATVRVLGTTFAVRHYATDTVVTVAVRDGRVAVGSTVLMARQLADVGPHGTTRVEEASSASFSFATGTLSLPQIPLSQAIPELDRWYDVDLRLADPALGARTIKADFDAGSLADLTSILELAFDVRVVRDGRVLTLFRRAPK